jgi:hypothetical protein
MHVTRTIDLHARADLAEAASLVGLIAIRAIFLTSNCHAVCESFVTGILMSMRVPISRRRHDDGAVLFFLHFCRRISTGSERCLIGPTSVALRDIVRPVPFNTVSVDLPIL